MILVLLLTLAFFGSAVSFQVSPNPNSALVAGIGVGRPDDLIQESEKEWESTLETKFPRSRKLYNEVCLDGSHDGLAYDTVVLSKSSSAVAGN